MPPVKFAIAVVLEHPEDPAKVLAVRRPDDDPDLPGVWGLPAVSVTAGELPEAAVRRLGQEKLATTIEPITFIGIQSADRETFELILMDIRCRLTGDEPSVIDATTDKTKYVEQQWTDDYSIFKEAAQKGSLCSQVFLAAHNISWK